MGPFPLKPRLAWAPGIHKVLQNLKPNTRTTSKWMVRVCLSAFQQCSNTTCCTTFLWCIQNLFNYQIILNICSFSIICTYDVFLLEVTHLDLRKSRKHMYSQLPKIFPATDQARFVLEVDFLWVFLVIVLNISHLLWFLFGMFAKPCYIDSVVTWRESYDLDSDKEPGCRVNQNNLKLIRIVDSPGEMDKLSFEEAGIRRQW